MKDAGAAPPELRAGFSYLPPPHRSGSVQANPQAGGGQVQWLS